MLREKECAVMRTDDQQHGGRDLDERIPDAELLNYYIL